MSSPSFELIGIGNPIMDLLAHVPESFLADHVAGEKGGMVLVDDTDIEQLVSKLGTDYAVTPGGSAAFAGAKHAHIEGYLLFNPALAEKVAVTARAAGCTISLELSSFEVVNVARDWILGQLQQGVDIVFANEDEVRALFQKDASYDA